MTSAVAPTQGSWLFLRGRVCADRGEFYLPQSWAMTGTGAKVRLHREPYRVTVAAGEVSAGSQCLCSAGFAVVAASSGLGLGCAERRRHAWWACTGDRA